MKRLLHTLLAVLVVSAVFAGCFGGSDDNGDADPSESPTPSPTPTNTTDPFEDVNLPPIPSMTVALETGGEDVEGPPFLVRPKALVNLTFDANGSSDPDGTIEGFAWTVSNSGGFTASSSNESFVAEIPSMSTEHFGVYTVTLKVLDDDRILNQTTRFFTIDYRNTLDLPTGMIGPGNAAREAEPQDRGLTDIPQQEAKAGTFNVHTVTLAENATGIELTVTFGTSTGAQLKVYLFDPSVPEADVEDDPDATVAKEEGPGDTGFVLDHNGTLDPGAWKVRVDLSGASVDSYSIEAVVTYTAPPLPEPDLGADNGTGETTSVDGALPLVPGLPISTPNEAPAPNRP